MTEPIAEDDLTWDDVWAAVGREVWKLAPQDFQDAGHRDLMFLTNWQDIMWAVQQGILAVEAQLQGAVEGGDQGRQDPTQQAQPEQVDP